jgi:hypothetical protein
VPIVGFWVPWLPFALPQLWPFCWWAAVGVDHYSRRVMGVATFKRQPTGTQVRAFLARAMRAAGTKPKYISCDIRPLAFTPRADRNLSENPTVGPSAAPNEWQTQSRWPTTQVADLTAS